MIIVPSHSIKYQPRCRIISWHLCKNSLGWIDVTHLRPNLIIDRYASIIYSKQIYQEICRNPNTSLISEYPFRTKEICDPLYQAMYQKPKLYDDRERIKDWFFLEQFLAFYGLRKWKSQGQQRKRWRKRWR